MWFSFIISKWNGNLNSWFRSRTKIPWIFWAFHRLEMLLIIFNFFWCIESKFFPISWEINHKVMNRKIMSTSMKIILKNIQQCQKQERLDIGPKKCPEIMLTVLSSPDIPWWGFEKMKIDSFWLLEKKHF